MSRWHRRLAELRGDDPEAPGAPVHNVQNVQNVQNSPPARPFEHSEQFEQRAEPDAGPATAVDRAAARWGEAEAERAASVEFDGAIPRTWAEGFARLDPDRPPGDLPPRRWRRFIDDAGAFLDCWAVHASGLGWGAHDLFGCDRDRPFARIDQAGLLWLLNGDKLVMLADDAATIEAATGARHTYRRKPSGPGRVLAWEL